MSASICLGLSRDGWLPVDPCPWRCWNFTFTTANARASGEHYELDVDWILIVTREGSHLFMQSAPDEPKVGIFPESDRDYFYKHHDEQITFETDSQG